MEQLQDPYIAFGVVLYVLSAIVDTFARPIQVRLLAKIGAIIAVAVMTLRINAGIESVVLIGAVALVIFVLTE